MHARYIDRLPGAVAFGRWIIVDIPLRMAVMGRQKL